MVADLRHYPQAMPIRMPRWFSSRPRMMFSIALGFVAYSLLGQLPSGSEVTRALIAWNVGALAYLTAAVHLMFRSTHDNMRRRALAQNDGEWVIMALGLLSAFTCLLGVVTELAEARSAEGYLRLMHLGHAILTLATSWLFTQVMFAQQYAHDYYAALEAGAPGGILFQHEDRPDYLDFLYMACVIGATSQTADVTFTSRYMRRMGLLHCLVSFFFNTTVLALTVNMASSLM